MIPAFRNDFNQQFTPGQYQKFLEDLNVYSGGPVPFRIAETPVFIPRPLLDKMVHASEEIIDLIKSPGYAAVSGKAVPPRYHVPGNEGKPLFLAFDFAVCAEDNGDLIPILIEMQGFPSLFFYQHLLAKTYKRHFNIDNSLGHLFGMNEEEYLDHMRLVLLANHQPENVILLELDPQVQNTRIDFIATQKNTGIPVVNIRDIIREGKNLYYRSGDKLIPVERIYNRVIFDELAQKVHRPLSFNMTEETDVEWAGHPNWYFRISKFTLPYLYSNYVPETRFLNTVRTLPDNLDDYVLKPLYSFSGSGVIFNIRKGDLESIPDPENYILQRKVRYEPALKSPGGDVKVEVRLMYTWRPGDENPKPVITLARLSRGEMIGVKYNRDFDWVGSSVGFFQE